MKNQKPQEPIETLKTNKPNSFVETYVWYQKGDTSYSGADSRRGYFLSVQPYSNEPSPTGGINWRTFSGYSGSKVFLEEANRFSQKRLNEIADTIKNDERYAFALKSVIERNGIVLQD
jgi:hypothetical protein